MKRYLQIFLLITGSDPIFLRFFEGIPINEFSDAVAEGAMLVIFSKLSADCDRSTSVPRLPERGTDLREHRGRYGGGMEDT